MDNIKPIDNIRIELENFRNFEHNSEFFIYDIENIMLLGTNFGGLSIDRSTNMERNNFIILES
jgi:hypothetical protein